MTWIVGSAPILGWSVGLSDIRVTLGDGSELDCLRKIYPVGRYIAAGFAGSVAIGFAMVRRLSQLLHNPDENIAWIPPEVAKWWQQDAKQVFNSFDACEQRLGSQVMLLAVHPNENVGDAPWARSYVYTFSWPNFDPILASPDEVVSIGSGAAVGPYRDLLREMPLDDSLFQLEAGHFGGMTDGIMMSITRKIEEIPTPGISPHMHVCLVSRGNIQIRKNDRRWINRPDLQDFLMPQVVESWRELEQLCQTRGVVARGALC